MAEWFWWILGTLCAAIAAVKVLGVGLCLVELRWKWRSIPELWGIDWLDIVYRVEREFGVALSAADFESLPADARVALTAGQLWEVVATKLQVAGDLPPPDGWQRVVTALSEALSVKPKQIAPDSRLWADLGMVYDVE